jgi:hypothetical protein
MTTATPEERLARARASLRGLSVGDAFGERFFTNPRTVEQLIESRAVPAPPWSYTDDTVMAISIVDVLADLGSIDGDRLADYFAARYRLDPAPRGTSVPSKRLCGLPSPVSAIGTRPAPSSAASSLFTPARKFQRTGCALASRWTRCHAASWEGALQR